MGKKDAEVLLDQVKNGADPLDIDRKNLNFLASSAKWS
jgi:hypothetical protein